jgi:methylisocitrate lyase
VKIACAASKECSNGEFIICARTDAKSVEGLEAVIKRSKLYIDAGADMIFPEGLDTPEEF